MMQLDVDAKLLGELLRTIREEAGLGQIVVGDRSGLNQSGVSRIERGEMPTLSQLTRLTRVLGTTVKAVYHEVRQIEVARLPLTRAIPIAEEWDGENVVSEDALYVPPTEVRDSEAFALRVGTDRLGPRYPAGSLAVVCPSERVRVGDLVAAKLTTGEIRMGYCRKCGDEWELAADPERGQPLDRIPAARLVKACPICRIMMAVPRGARE